MAGGMHTIWFEWLQVAEDLELTCVTCFKNGGRLFFLKFCTRIGFEFPMNGST